ncbi:MAG: RNase A-like domain-containing protein [Alphaproteobacteria bacterium]
MILTALALYTAAAAAPAPALYAEAAPQRISRADCQSARPPARRPPRPRGRRHLRLGPGGLRAHEDAWGHCCRKHVGRTDQQLIARLRSQRDLRKVSTFSNMKVAQSSLRATLNHNSRRIWEWQVAGAPPRLVIRYHMPGPIGRYMRRGMKKPAPGRTAYFLLRLNKHFPGGFQVITGGVER